jgi:hypothetical protein
MITTIPTAWSKHPAQATDQPNNDATTTDVEITRPQAEARVSHPEARMDTENPPEEKAKQKSGKK